MIPSEHGRTAPDSPSVRLFGAQAPRSASLRVARDSPEAANISRKSASVVVGEKGIYRQQSRIKRTKLPSRPISVVDDPPGAGRWRMEARLAGLILQNLAASGSPETDSARRGWHTSANPVSQAELAAAQYNWSQKGPYRRPLIDDLRTNGRTSLPSFWSNYAVVDAAQTQVLVEECR